jgi:hypothetical protein
VRLIGESAGERDRGERLFGKQHHLLRPFDSAANDVCMGRLAEIQPECPREAASAQAGDAGQITDSDGTGQICLDELDGTLSLPRR